MTRMLLCVTLSVLCFCTGVLTAVIQSHNHDRGIALNVLKERCSMIEAINGDRAAQILACDYGPLPADLPAANPPAAAMKPVAQNTRAARVTP
jgi:hypothetical protein